MCAIILWLGCCCFLSTELRTTLTNPQTIAPKRLTHFCFVKAHLRTKWSTRRVVQMQKSQAKINSERIPKKSSHDILPMEVLAGKITSSLYESNFACYYCINGITSTADEYNFTS